MEFTVKQTALLNELNLVRGVVPKNSHIPILANILVAADNNRLDIVGTDLDVSIACGCEAEVHAPGAITLSVRRLFEIVRLLPDADIQFKSLAGDSTQLSCGQSRYKLMGLPRENYPTIPLAESSALAIPGAVLQGMINRTAFAITQEESRYTLNGALLVLNATEIKMVTTDGHRLAITSKPMALPIDTEIRTLIPRKALVEVLKFTDQNPEVEFSRDDNHLFFSVAGRKLIARILAGQFPNYDMVVPKDNDRHLTIPTNAFADALRRVAVMSDERLRAVRLHVMDGKAELSASSTEAGEATDTLEIQYEGEEFEVGFNPQYILEFLAACSSDSVVFSLRDGETPGLLRPASEQDHDYRYVVMPMKF